MRVHAFTTQSNFENLSFINQVLEQRQILYAGMKLRKKNSLLEILLQVVTYITLYNLWCFALFGTICAILKTWETPIKECYF